LIFCQNAKVSLAQHLGYTVSPCKEFLEYISDKEMQSQPYV
jgi:hypothetical protein